MTCTGGAQRREECEPAPAGVHHRHARGGGRGRADLHPVRHGRKMLARERARDGQGALGGGDAAHVDAPAGADLPVGLVLAVGGAAGVDPRHRGDPKDEGQVDQGDHRGAAAERRRARRDRDRRQRDGRAETDGAERDAARHPDGRRAVRRLLGLLRVVAQGELLRAALELAQPRHAASQRLQHRGAAEDQLDALPVDTRPGECSSRPRFGGADRARHPDARRRLALAHVGAHLGLQGQVRAHGPRPDAIDDAKGGHHGHSEALPARHRRGAAGDRLLRRRRPQGRLVGGGRSHAVPLLLGRGLRLDRVQGAAGHRKRGACAVCGRPLVLRERCRALLALASASSAVTAATAAAVAAA
mmetsp:Transcript_39274/g.127094  ORF Transcript_39274/g.127094 Transcript_39274/m.127094 type:complete len:358 (-) Transcript_39274:1784-2857(-)